jgi:hypothetical protein
METLKKIFYHPNFNVVAGLFGIAGVLFGIFTYYESIKEPDLTFYVSPTRTPIVQKGNLDNFSVTLLGTPITGDLSSAEIQIWNQGKQPIRREDILKTIALRTPNGEPIYQITGKATRDVVGFNWITSSNKQSGVEEMDWKILEQNDGIKVQIIYGGNVNLPLILDGVIVGQKKFTQFQQNQQITPNALIKLLIYFIVIVLLSAALVSMFELATLLKVQTIDKKRDITINKKRAMIILPLLILLIILAVFGFEAGGNYISNYILPPSKPPFGF